LESRKITFLITNIEGGRKRENCSRWEVGRSEGGEGGGRSQYFIVALEKLCTGSRGKGEANATPLWRTERGKKGRRKQFQEYEEV